MGSKMIRTQNLAKIVTDTHAASLKLREEVLRKTIAKDTAWPPDNMLGDAVWILSALYLNERVDEANARLLKQANEFIALNRTADAAVTPKMIESNKWWMFGTTEYVRTLCLFYSGSAQHENVLILQRIAPMGRSTLGSYHTDAVGIGFEGKALQKVEKDGWIFASNGKAFVGVKFLDGAYQWNEKRPIATPSNFNNLTDRSRILLIAGDINTGDSFKHFQSAVLANPLRTTTEVVSYEFGPAKDRIEMNSYDPRKPDKFTLPRINGKAIDLHPAATYQSPYLNGDFNGDQFTVTVGPIRRVLDFSEAKK